MNEFIYYLCYFNIWVDMLLINKFSFLTILNMLIWVLLLALSLLYFQMSNNKYGKFFSYWLLYQINIFSYSRSRTSRAYTQYYSIIAANTLWLIIWSSKCEWFYGSRECLSIWTTSSNVSPSSTSIPRIWLNQWSRASTWV